MCVTLPRSQCEEIRCLVKKMIDHFSVFSFFRKLLTGLIQSVPFSFSI